MEGNDKLIKKQKTKFKIPKRTCSDAATKRTDVSVVIRQIKVGNKLEIYIYIEQRKK